MVQELDTLVPGTVLQERYTVGEVLGRGGMGTVYRGTDTVLDREVALKIFRPDVADASEVRRQHSEMRLLAKLNHHGLVTLFDAGTAVQGHREVPFLVMELIPGSDLRRRIAAGPITGAEVARIGSELAEALQYIHHHGVVHRDVKPANILLAKYAERAGFRTKLADFGIARMVEGARLTATNTVPGTAAYLSPEQASGASVGPAADIYSLGLVLLEALTGKVAFSGPPLEAAVARLSRDPAVPDVVGPHWKSLLTLMTARDPRTRPDAGHLVRTLTGGGDWSTQMSPAPATEYPAEPVPQQTLLLGGTSAPHPGAANARHGDLAAGFLPALSGSELTNASSWRSTPLVPPHKPASARQEPVPGKLRRNLRSWTNPRHTGRRRLSISAAALAAVAVLVFVVLLGPLQSPAPGPADAPAPTIPGPMGAHFAELEESVRP